MGSLNEILNNSQNAEGNMEAMQSETQMQGLMNRNNITEQDKSVGVKEGTVFKDF